MSTVADPVAILNDATTIAVVGASSDPTKAAHQIPRVLLAAGYTVIPVHPSAPEVLGQRAYRTLADVPVPIDIVNVFRPADEAPAIATQAVEVGARTLWLQQDITSDEARAIAESGGLAYVEDQCTGATTRRHNTHPPARSDHS